MRARPNPVEALITLPRQNDVGERRANWRQAIAALGQSTRLLGPPPLDNVDTARLAQAVEIAVDSGLADDLDWIAPGSAAVALFEMMSALPQGRPRRELGRRVFARLYEGTATTFAAVATRMALGSGRSLDAPTMRARVGLLLDLPIGSAVNADTLAFTLVTRRELCIRWIESASFGALPARRLAARLLERAAREAVTRAQHGDPYGLSLMVHGDLEPSMRRLLSDREPLVWRHAATARGLLAALQPAIRDEVDVGLDLGLTPTEWRRSAVSLVAAMMVDPELLPECVRLAEGELGQRDPGIAAAMIMGLPLVVEAEPDAAEELLERLGATRRPDVAEAVAALLWDVQNPKFAAKTAHTLHDILTKRASHRTSLLPGIAALALGAVEREPATRDTVQESVRQAVVAYEARGARAAYELAVAAVNHAHDVLDFVARENPYLALDPAPILTALGDIDASTLERARIADLLLLGRRPGETVVSIPELERLHNRLGVWLLDAEEHAAKLEWSPHVGLTNQRCLRVLLHLVDLETTRGDAADADVAARLRRTVRVLVQRLAEEPDPSLHRILCATLARSFDAAVREGIYEPSDLLLLVAHQLTDPQSISTIAEASTNLDIAGPIAAYAEFVAPVSDEDDEAAERSEDDDERHLAQQLVQLSHHIGSSGSYRGEALRQTALRLARALQAAATANGLSELVDTSGSGLDTVTELELAADALRRVVASAVRRTLGDESEIIPVVADIPSISALIERAVGAGVPANAEQISMAVNELTAELPTPIGYAMRTILARIGRLPITAAAEAEAIPLGKRRAVLPDWLLPRRTIGSFYVVRALGSGGVSSVFMARRFEERHNPHAEAFALKVPHYDPTTARSLSEQEFFELFRDEAGALLSLPQHPNLARFVTFDLAARPKPILVMELIEGIGLDRLIRGRTLETGRALDYLDGMLAGLEAMHGAGVGHLDVKPSNVILRGGETPVLVDFGLSGRHLRPGCGTLEYCAPEVLGVVPRGVTPAPSSADMYSFACLAFELLTSSMLFDADDEMRLMSMQVSHDGWPDKLMAFGGQVEYAELSVILAACLRRDPRQRPTAAETRAALVSIRSRLADYPWPLELRRQRTA